MKIGDNCFVSTLPTNIFPIDIALGIQEIKKGNNETDDTDEIRSFGILIELESLQDNEKNALHSDIKARCSNSEIKDFKEIPIRKEHNDDLMNGKIIFLDKPTTSNTCFLMVFFNISNSLSNKSFSSLLQFRNKMFSEIKFP